MNIDSNNTLRGNTTAVGKQVGFSQYFKLDSKEYESRVEGIFRISDHQRLLFSHFKYDKIAAKHSISPSRTTTSPIPLAALSRAS